MINIISRIITISKNVIELFIAELKNHAVIVGLYQDINNKSSVAKLTDNKHGNAEGSRTIAWWYNILRKPTLFMLVSCGCSTFKPKV